MAVSNHSSGSWAFLSGVDHLSHLSTTIFLCCVVSECQCCLWRSRMAMVCYEMMLACFEGNFQSSVSGSGWNEGPDLCRDWSLWPRCGVLHSGLWSGSKKMVITCLQPMWSQGHWRCAEVAGGVDSWSCLMLTALSASRSAGIDVHTVEELCGWDVWPVSSVTPSLDMLFQRFLKTKKTNFGSECCSHHIVTDCRCYTLEMLNACQSHLNSE